jgi:hypothetical protein
VENSWDARTESFGGKGKVEGRKDNVRKAMLQKGELQKENEVGKEKD